MPPSQTSRQSSPTSSPKVEKLKSKASSESFYSVLGVAKEATASQIKQAYYKMALKYHPDRAPEQKEEYEARFKEISFAYEILSDPEKRQVYDRNPNAFAEGNADISRFTQMFTKISTEDIESFKRHYVGSAEELEDIMAAYLKYFGDMAKISETVFFGSVYEEDRYAEIIKRQIAKGILPDYISGKKTPESEKRKAHRMKRAEKEAKEAAAYAKELGLNNNRDSGEGSLVALIQNRQKSRFDDMISGLEAKYGSSPSSLKRVRSDEVERNSPKRLKSNFPAKTKHK